MSKKYFYFSIVALIGIITLGYIVHHVLNNDLYKIPIQFDEAKIPLISASFEDKQYLLELDLGAADFSLNREELAKLQKIPKGLNRSEDVFGNKYEVPIYVIEHFNVQRLKWKNIIISEEDPAFDRNTLLWEDVHQTEVDGVKKSYGRIGRNILKKTNLLLDFPNNLLYACNNLTKLKKKNYHIHDWIAIPFEETDSGIIIKITTDFGLKKFVFDTGCSAIFIRSENLSEKNLFEKETEELFAYTTSKFMIGSYNFSNIKLYQLQFSDLYKDVDGFLGMNFIEDYQIYVDYKSKKIFINPMNFHL